MMVEIKITGNTPLEALSSLTAFGMHCMQNKDVWDATNRILEAEKHEEAKKKAAMPESTASTTPPPAQTAPAPQHDPAPTEAPGPAGGGNGPTAAPTEKPSGTEAPIPTAEEVTAKGREAAKKYGSAAIKPILKEFGVERMSELAEKDRAAFLARLERLGEENA